MSGEVLRVRMRGVVKGCFVVIYYYSYDLLMKFGSIWQVMPRLIPAGIMPGEGE